MASQMPEVEFDEEQPYGSKLKGMETKETNTMEKAVAPAGQDTTEEELDIEKRDKEELARMGKLPQYKRLYSQLSALALTVTIGASWQVFCLSLIPGLQNGGTGGLFWMFILTFVANLSNVLSIAEYSSIAPINGGQYHWVSEFAPKHGKSLSYFTGWFSSVAWTTTAAGATFLAGSFVLSTAALFHPSYEPVPWQNSLSVFACMAIILLINGTSTKPLVVVQVLAMLILFIGWIPLSASLLGLAPHPRSFHEVIFSFTSVGWKNIAWSTQVGQISIVYSLTSFDAPAHIAEEVKNAALTVPRAIFWGFFTNAGVAFIVMASVVYALPDVNVALNSPTGSPFIYAVQQAGPTWAKAISILIIFIAIAGATGCNAAASREIAAFARDRALPCSEWLAKVGVSDDSTRPPRNAVLTIAGLVIGLVCINFGSTVAFNAIISSQLMSLNASYILVHFAAIWARQVGTYPGKAARWSLGRWGVYANAIALVYCSYLIVVLAFPPTPDVDPVNFNWGPVMFGAVFVFALCYYFLLGGRQCYRDPDEDVIGNYELQPSDASAQPQDALRRNNAT